MHSYDTMWRYKHIQNEKKNALVTFQIHLLSLVSPLHSTEPEIQPELQRQRGLHVVGHE